MHYIYLFIIIIIIIYFKFVSFSCLLHPPSHVTTLEISVFTFLCHPGILNVTMY